MTNKFIEVFYDGGNNDSRCKKAINLKYVTQIYIIPRHNPMQTFWRVNLHRLYEQYSNFIEFETYEEALNKYNELVHEKSQCLVE